MNGITSDSVVGWKCIEFHLSHLYELRFSYIHCQNLESQSCIKTLVFTPSKLVDSVRDKWERLILVKTVIESVKPSFVPYSLVYHINFWAQKQPKSTQLKASSDAQHIVVTSKSPSRTIIVCQSCCTFHLSPHFETCCALFVVIYGLIFSVIVDGSGSVYLRPKG